MVHDVARDFQSWGEEEVKWLAYCPSLSCYQEDSPQKKKQVILCDLLINMLIIGLLIIKLMALTSWRVPTCGILLAGMTSD